PFEERYSLTSAGSITHHHEAKPGAARIRELQGLIADGKITCILTEPQSDQRLVKVLAENAKVKAVSVDPSGSTFEPGPDLYFALIKSIASAFQECLSG
ncbi:MAG: metal ABC transporter solute-binding protein, Zn/Mn family, partial [Rhizobiaceae bacterium]